MKVQKSKSLDLFLLMLNLSELTSKEKIIDAFVNALKEIWSNINISYHLLKTSKKNYSIEISTSKNIFGYINFEHSIQLEDEDLQLLHNAAAMLAIILIKNEQDKLLANEKLLLQKLSDETIRSLLLRQEALLFAVPEIIMEVDNKKTYTWANKHGLEFFGEDVVGHDADFYFEGEQDTYSTVQPLFNASENQLYVESLQRRKDGEKRLLAWYCTALKDGKGKVIGALSTARDITEFKQANEALREREQNYKTLADSGQALIWTSGTDKLCDYLNQVWLDFTGRTLEQEIGDGWIEGVHPDDLKRCLNIYEKAFDLRERFSREYRLRRYDGNYRWIIDDGCPRYNSNGDFIGYIGHCLDISERKRTEAAHRESEDRYRTIVSNIPEGMVHVIDREMKYVFSAGEELTRLGLSNEFLVGKSIHEVLPVDLAKMAEEQYRRVLNGETVRFEGPYGEDYFRMTSAPLRDANNDILYILTLSLKITEKKQAEEAIIKAKEKAEESDRLKTAFLHNISHEIRTPLNAIVGFSSFLNEPGLSADKRKHFTEIITQSSSQLLSIISDIISIATVEAGQEKIQEKNININAIFKLLHDQYLLKVQKQNISLHYNTSLSDDEANIKTDETKLMQVLNNIIGNALKFTINGSVNFGYNIKDNNIEFFVEDTGIGIPKEMHEEIFKRFRQVDGSKTRQYGGSGLGLSISKAYVELLGGKLWLVSELDKGTVFYFTIPYQKTNTIEYSPKKPAKKQLLESVKPKTILVAEDEDFNFMLLEEQLANINITILRARNGIEAVEICKSHPKIDLVLMDIKMPLMNGYEATARIREFMPDLPIIAQTAFATEIDKNKALECGCNDYVSKPINDKLLIAKINKQFKTA